MANNLKMFLYKQGSKSGQLLAEKLNCLRIKHEGSEYRGKMGDFILNWGAGNGVYAARTALAKLWNRPDLIDIAVNKLDFFQSVDVAGGPRVIPWTTSREEARTLLKFGHTIIGRKVLEGSKGAGIVVINKMDDLVQCPLYTVKVPNKAEYRVYLWRDTVIDVRLKGFAPDATKESIADKLYIGNEVQFNQLDMARVPGDVLVQAKKVFGKLPLDLQGVDVIWDGEKAWVAETNTAPYLGIQTANKYAAAILREVEAA